MPKEMPEIDPKQVQQLAAQGLNMAQIAHCCDVSRSYLYSQKKAKKNIKNALKRGGSKGIGVVTNALFQSAKGGNVVAQIFFLKNRAPERWRDRRDHEISGKDGKPIDLNWTVEIIEPNHAEPT